MIHREMIWMDLKLNIGGNREILVSRCKVWLYTRGLLYSVMPIVNNTALFSSSLHKALGNLFSSLTSACLLVLCLSPPHPTLEVAGEE